MRLPIVPSTRSQKPSRLFRATNELTLAEEASIRGDGGKQRIELKEVFLVDEQRVPVFASRTGFADGAGDIETGESPAQNQEPLLLHGQRIPCRCPKPARGLSFTVALVHFPPSYV